MQTQRVHSLTPKDLETILDLHFSTLKESTLNQFGRKFLKVVYQTALQGDNNIFLTIVDSEKIIGYAVATTNIDQFYKQIISQIFLSLLLESIKSAIRKPTLFIKSFTWLLTHQSDKKYPAELQFIAVNLKYQ